MARQDIFAEIEGERAYQQEKWGDDFDNKNTINDWVVYIGHYCSRAAKRPTGYNTRLSLVKVAALAVAAVEAYDRNDGFPARHYDEKSE